jgi:hypothetical protein
VRALAMGEGHMNSSGNGNRRREKGASRACQEGKNYKVNVSGCNHGKNNSAKVGGITLLDLLF